MNRDFRHEIFKKDYRPTATAEVIEERLRIVLRLQKRYEPARLCIGRSLANPPPPQPIPAGEPRGKPIPGEMLLGDDLDLWLSLLLVDGEFGEEATPEDVRNHLEAHWHRGALLLQRELDESQGEDVGLLMRLADLLPAGPRVVASSGAGPAAALRLSVGPISLAYPMTEPLTRIEFVLNGPGDAPHMALMGRAGTGKSTTGVQMAAEIVRQTSVPLLFIDPKGEFVQDGAVAETLLNAVPGIRPIEVGVGPIPLDFLPSKGVGSATIIRAAMQFRDSLASCCRGAGDIQRDMLRSAVESVIRRSEQRDLPAIRDAYQKELEHAERKHDSVQSRLNELTNLKVYAALQQPEIFFGQSWVISLRTLGTEELKRAVILLLIDALAAHVLMQPDSEVEGGYRRLRHLLVIDEARRILADKKYQSLVDLLRQGRSKGEVVMLLSQDPSDFEGQADDFTTQLGTVVAFACAQTERGLRALSGAYGRRLQPHEFSDVYLPTGVAFVKLPGRQPERVQCWSAAPPGDNTSPE